MFSIRITLLLWIYFKLPTFSKRKLCLLKIKSLEYERNHAEF